MKDQFIIEEDEELVKQLGDIFLTSKGRVSFHCTICEEAYCNFESFQAHLNKAHKITNSYLEDEAEMVAEISLIETDSQIESNGDESEHEDLVVFSAGEIKENEESISKDKITNIVSTELSVTTEVRQIMKRTAYKKQNIPEEDRKYKCPICGTGFKEKYNVKHHLKRHSHERNHVCPYCDKGFYSSTDLNKHINTHTKERPLLCNECGKTFTTKTRLEDHLKRHRGQKDYYCQHPGCQKTFYNSACLKNHMLLHSSERTQKCSICGSAFKQKTALKNHIKLHENKKEYKCEICGAEFNQKAGKFSHMKIVHKAAS